MQRDFESKKDTNEPEHEETFHERQERLRAVLNASLEVYQNPDRRLEDGAVTVRRRLRSGAMETLSGLVVAGLTDDGVEFCGIEEDGGPSASAVMGWEEIIDVTKEAGHDTNNFDI